MRGPSTPADGRGGDDDDGTIRTTFDWSKTPPAVAVVEALAVATNAEILDVEPLMDHVEPEALNALINDQERPDTDTVVIFEMAGHEVTVHADGRVVLRPL